MVLLIATVFWLADAERHPLRATVVLYGIVLIGSSLFMAWSVYNSKRKDWEQRQRWRRQLDEL